jgi:UDP-GlcNAc:undecaprenyl-phosphate GlcNAc-1-phosphate transferase
MLSLLLAGATLGFLVFNIHPASIFMGDSGSLFLGFFIASISLMGFKSSTFITLGFPILLLAVPLIDTFSAVLRRLLKRQSIVRGDRNHLHHVLMKRHGHRNTVFIIYGITLCFGVSAYLYIYDKILGLSLICILFLGMEFFIEKTGLISERYKPILYVLNRIKKEKHK